MCFPRPFTSIAVEACIVFVNVWLDKVCNLRSSESRLLCCATSFRMLVHRGKCVDITLLESNVLLDLKSSFVK